MKKMNRENENEIYKRDSKIKRLSDLISNRKKILRENYKTVQNSSNENAFLVDVANDYMLYYKKINDDKEKQLEYLTNLSIYLDELASDINNTKEMKMNIKNDRKEVMREIKKIQNEL
jgi:chromosome segregation ATPase